jgi:hypothetical protein
MTRQLLVVWCAGIATAAVIDSGPTLLLIVASLGDNTCIGLR